MNDEAPPDSPTAPLSATSKRELSKARKREQILQAGREVFAEKGFDGATIRDIIRKTGMAVGTFYLYYREKGEVFSEIADEALANVRSRLHAERTREHATMEERLHGAYRAFFEFALNERVLFEILDRNQGSIPGDPYRQNTGLLIEEVQRDFAEDLAAGAEVEPWLLYAAAMMCGLGLFAARNMLEESSPDPSRTATLATAFTMQGLSGLFPHADLAAEGDSPEKISRKEPE